MEEIKLRFNALQNIFNGVWNTNYLATNIEFMFLQMRKILELIILSSLVICKKEYDNIHQKILNEYNAGRVLTALEKINPNFYPRPVIPVLQEDGIILELKTYDRVYLTKDDFNKLYGTCGNMLHVPAFSKPELDYLGKQKYIMQSMEKIQNLLRYHVIEMKDSDILFLIHMSVNGDSLGIPYEKQNLDNITNTL